MPLPESGVAQCLQLVSHDTIHNRSEHLRSIANQHNSSLAPFVHLHLCNHVVIEVVAAVYFLQETIYMPTSIGEGLSQECFLCLNALETYSNIHEALVVCLDVHKYSRLARTVAGPQHDSSLSSRMIPSPPTIDREVCRH